MAISNRLLAKASFGLQLLVFAILASALPAAQAMCPAKNFADARSLSLAHTGAILADTCSDPDAHSDAETCSNADAYSDADVYSNANAVGMFGLRPGGDRGEFIRGECLGWSGGLDRYDGARPGELHEQRKMRRERILQPRRQPADVHFGAAQRHNQLRAQFAHLRKQQRLRRQ
jgi:hypothetical protein